jgi:hypothetical protein
MAKEQKQMDDKLARIRVLMENLINAIAADDATAMEQTAAAAREFLDQNPA